MLAGVAAAVALFAPAVSADDRPFDVVELAGRGRTVAAELVDLDGDGRTDVLQIAYVGQPPDERRLIRVFFQQADGRLPVDPQLEAPLPAGAAIYDVADIREGGGEELIVLRAGSLVVVQFSATGVTETELAVAGATTVGAAADERGFKRSPLAFFDWGRPPLLIVPQFDAATVLSADGETLARLDVGGRANYVVQAYPGPLYVESDVQVFYDFPRLSVGDVDGDGRADVLAASRHEIRLFLRRANGDFGQTPDRVVPLRRVSERDHVRGSGAVRVSARDVNADGRIDLLISQVSGGLLDARTVTSIHLNDEGQWDLDQPASVFERESAWGADELVDLDGDGTLELVLIRTPMTVFELAEALVQRAVDAEIAVYKLGADGRFGAKPWTKLKLAVPLNFSTGRTRGFLPTTRADLDGDGYKELLASGGGERIEVFRGGDPPRYSRPVTTQKLDTAGRLRTGDIDGDGRIDLLLHDHSVVDGKIRVLRNRDCLRSTDPGCSEPRQPILRAP